MKQTKILVGDPKISPTVLCDGLHGRAGNRAYGNKPAILKIGDSARRRGPDSPATVLKERLHSGVRERTIVNLAHRWLRTVARERTAASLAIDGDLSVI